MSKVEFLNDNEIIWENVAGVLYTDKSGKVYKIVETASKGLYVRLLEIDKS